MPENSYDGVAGSRPSGQLSSSRVIAAAWTRTRASPGAGFGVRIRSYLSDTVSPSACSRTARIWCSIIVLLHVVWSGQKVRLLLGDR
jgi:hypothetical protein